MNIGFFIDEYPALNTTFILYELYALQKAGVSGSIFYESAFSGTTQPVAAKILFPRIWINAARHLHKRPFQVIAYQVRLFLRNPRRYISALMVLFGMWSRENLYYFLRASYLASSVEAQNFSLFYVHDAPGISIIGLFCKYLYGIPTGIMFHTYGLFADSRYLGKKIYHADFAIFQSEYSRGFVTDSLRIGEKQRKKMFTVSSAGIDTDFFRSKRHVASPLSAGVLRIISVGRLEKMKGFDTLIQTVSLLKTRGINIRCTIIGEGTQRLYLRRLVKQLGLQREITFTGALGHSGKFLSLLQHADIFVLPSQIDAGGDRDMQPNVIKEAMSVGLIVLTARFGGIEEVIDNGKNGYLLDAVGAVSVASAIEHIRNLPVGTLRRIRLNARAIIESKYAADRIHKDLLTVLQGYGDTR